MADDTFRAQYKQLSGAQTDQLADMKSDASMLLRGLQTMGESREMSLAITKLEEAVMWATKHITR